MKNKTDAEYSSKRESNEPILIQFLPTVPEKNTGGRSVHKKPIVNVCTCGKCNCRKHHCLIHHSQTSNLVGDQNLKENYNPKSDYQMTFKPAQNDQIVRPSLIVHPRILPDINKKSMELMSVNHRDFVALPVEVKTKTLKPGQQQHVSSAPFVGHTSYKFDYPARVVDSNPAAETLMRTTIPQINEVPNKSQYNTTNQSELKKWSGNYRSIPYCEPHQQLYFEGKFNGDTMFQKDFTADILRNGKPSTSCKKMETSHQSNAQFSGATTNKTVYKLPMIGTRDPVHLRNQSKKNNETIEQQIGKIQSQTQYKIDNPGYKIYPAKRGICPPAVGKLKLFEGQLNSQSEQHSSFVKFSDSPRPRTSFKKTERLHTSTAGKHFNGETTTGTQYQPIPLQKQMAEQHEVDRLAAKVGFEQKNGIQLKQVQHFGGELLNSTTTNQNDYFQFWKTNPRQRYGDSCEKRYQPSTAHFSSMSETKSSYVPMDCKPSESFKPLDLRYKKASNGVDRKMLGETAYKSDYPRRAIPTKEMCPAELLFQTA